ncbi:MAG: hypothetical protein QM581_00945 [Pseudomonas sp.]
MQTIIGMPPHVMVIGMPQPSMRCMLSQHSLSMSMLIMPVGIIMQTMPCDSILQLICGIIGMPQQAIIGMLPHIIPHGVPQDIIDIIMSQQSLSISIVQPSAGFITHIMPSAVMAQSMWHIIGIMVAIGMADMPGIGMVFVGIDIMFIAVFMASSSSGRG